MSAQGHSVSTLVSQSTHTAVFFFNCLRAAFWSALNRTISVIRIKPCFSPRLQCLADNGQALEKNGALQCVVSVANPHDNLLTIMARGWEGFQQPIQPEPAPLWPIVC